MDEAVELYEVVVPREIGGSGLDPGQIARYEAAEIAFARGDMRSAVDQLREASFEDPVARFLSREAHRYEECGVPLQWGGWIEFSSK
jgi:hypothetical protein